MANCGVWLRGACDVAIRAPAQALTDGFLPPQDWQGRGDEG